ncbi:MAG: hypothetical protein K6C10_08740 [Prevotella sp.]|nr:hypothetical protein [Prevotella sp.]
MKKLIYSLAVLFALMLAACDPVEEFTENTAGNFTGDQIDATLVQENGDNLVQVTVHTPGTAQISNGKQTIKANYADLILREMGLNTVYITMLNAKGEIVEKQYPVTVTQMTYELPVLETVVWQGEQSCNGWDGASLRFSDSEGKLPTLSDETYDWMVGKKMCLDIKEVNGDGTTIRVTNGWWSTTYVEDTEVHAGDKFTFEFTQQMCDDCKKGAGGRDLLFVSNNGLTITKFYYEL